MRGPDTEPARPPYDLKFAPGDVVLHGLTGARGVVVEVDPSFSGSDSQLLELTRHRGPKKSPWYYVLFEGSRDSVYVAECHLMLDRSGDSVKHPLVKRHFTGFTNGRYIRLNH